MKLFTVALLAASVAMALTQAVTDDPTSTTTTTETPTTTTSTKAPTTTPKPTTNAPTSTTPKPTTNAPTTSTTEIPSTTTTAPPKPQDPTLGNYTMMRGEEVCVYMMMRVIITQNSTRIPFVNATLDTKDSQCTDESATLLIVYEDNRLQIKIEHDKTNFYISEVMAGISNGSAERGNLTQFSTPMTQYYKCSSPSEVDLAEQNIKVIFSDMKYQAFKKTKTADFVGAQLECKSDSRSDIVIIAIGCALALLVVVILIAYLIARRRNRQRGYQSV